MMSELVRILAGTLLHSLWQFALLGILLCGVLKLIPKGRADIRYAAALIALYLAPIIFLLTSLKLGGSASPAINLKAGQHAAMSISAWVVALWGAGFFWSTIKLLHNTAEVYRLSHMPLSSLDVVIKQRFDSLVHKSGMKRAIKIGFSDKIKTVCTIGFIKPIIFLPMTLTTRLSVLEIEAILAHELAHILRNDFFHHCIQALLNTLFYYHPAIRLISDVVSKEREYACDDLAVKLIEDRKFLATGLLKISLSAQPEKLALNAVSPQLMDIKVRIGRLIHIKDSSLRKPHLRRQRSLTLMLMVAFLVVSATGLFASASSSQLDQAYLVNLKAKICDQLYADNIYWNPVYDTGGAANIRIVDNIVYMNSNPLPEETQGALRQILEAQNLSNFETISVKYWGDMVELSLITPSATGDASVQVFEYKSGRLKSESYKMKAERFWSLNDA